jgi:hypothetical protein
MAFMGVILSFKISKGNLKSVFRNQRFEPSSISILNVEKQLLGKKLKNFDQMISILCFKFLLI